MKRDGVTYFLVIVFIASLIVMIWALSSGAAPAPLPRRAKHSPVAIPHTCVVHWSDYQYQTTFATDGWYQATRVGKDSDRWTGTWDIRRDGEGLVLTIRESSGDVMRESHSTYVMRMDQGVWASGDGQIRLQVK